MPTRRELMQSPRFTLCDLLVECPAFIVMIAFLTTIMMWLGSLAE